MIGRRFGTIGGTVQDDLAIDLGRLSSIRGEILADGGEKSTGEVRCPQLHLRRLRRNRMITMASATPVPTKSAMLPGLPFVKSQRNELENRMMRNGSNRHHPPTPSQPLLRRAGDRPAFQGTGGIGAEGIADGGARGAGNVACASAR